MSEKSAKSKSKAEPKDEPKAEVKEEKAEEETVSNLLGLSHPTTLDLNPAYQLDVDA